MFLGEAYYDAGSQQHAPQPSQFSTELFSRLFAFANDTQNRVPLSDWTMTEAPNVAGFAARPVYGAMYCRFLKKCRYAPALVEKAKEKGLGAANSAQSVRARRVFDDVHRKYEQQKQVN